MVVDFVCFSEPEVAVLGTAYVVVFVVGTAEFQMRAQKVLILIRRRLVRPTEFGEKGKDTVVAPLLAGSAVSG